MRNAFGNLRVGAKILAAVALVGLVAVTVAVLGIVRMHNLNTRAKEMRTNNIESIERIDDARAGIESMYEHLAFYFALLPTGGGPTISQEAPIVKADDAMVDKALDGYVSTLKPSDTRDPLNVFKEAVKQYRGLRDVALFGVAPPAGVDIPSDPNKFAPEFQARTKTVDAAINALAAAENAGAEYDAASAQSTYEAGIRDITIVIVVGLIIALLFAILIARAIVGPLGLVSESLAKVADGDLTTVVPVQSRDEVGRMAGSLNRATESVRETVRALAASADTLAESSHELTGLADQIAVSAESASTQANTAAGSAELVSRNMNTVAAGSGEMGASIREISHSANEGAKVAGQAVAVARSTTETIANLGESSARIGSVIKAITSIAEQTNLLALNATIEAARAGEAGKGFAVVAGEVKDLAQETAKATEDISKRVEAIQADTGRAVAAISEITDIIARINDYQVTIASAVEEQTATTNEMNRNVGEAAGLGTQIAANISGVATAARATATSTADSRRASADLSRLSQELRALVTRFTY